jgi:hypothetical protein
MRNNNLDPLQLAIAALALFIMFIVSLFVFSAGFSSKSVALDERQGLITADAPAHASAGIDTLAHEDLHVEPLRKGDKLK